VKCRLTSANTKNRAEARTQPCATKSRPMSRFPEYTRNEDHDIRPGQARKQRALAYRPGLHASQERPPSGRATVRHRPPGSARRCDIAPQRCDRPTPRPAGQGYRRSAATTLPRVSYGEFPIRDILSRSAACSTRTHPGRTGRPGWPCCPPTSGMSTRPPPTGITPIPGLFRYLPPWLPDGPVTWHDVLPWLSPVGIIRCLLLEPAEALDDVVAVVPQRDRGRRVARGNLTPGLPQNGA
jgi:hypothetical protein